METLAKELAKELRGGQVIGLVGELGSGKTTFVQFLAKALGVKEKVNSPTFVLMKIYQIPGNNKQTNFKLPIPKIKQFIHVDAYRLNSAEELENIGLRDYLNCLDTLVVIEWADKVKEILSDNSLIFNFFYGQTDEERSITVLNKPEA